MIIPSLEPLASPELYEIAVDILFRKTGTTQYNVDSALDIEDGALFLIKGLGPQELPNLDQIPLKYGKARISDRLNDLLGGPADVHRDSGILDILTLLLKCDDPELNDILGEKQVFQNIMRKWWKYDDSYRGKRIWFLIDFTMRCITAVTVGFGVLTARLVITDHFTSSPGSAGRRWL